MIVKMLNLLRDQNRKKNHRLRIIYLLMFQNYWRFSSKKKNAGVAFWGWLHEWGDIWTNVFEEAEKGILNRVVFFNDYGSSSSLN